jgi:hypothetical protein
MRFSSPLNLCQRLADVMDRLELGEHGSIHGVQVEYATLVVVVP